MDTTRVVVGSDHAGFPLKESVKKYLESKGVEVIDVGTDNEEPIDYPAIMRKAADVALKEGISGFIFGGSGNGEAMAANKMRGIRAAVGFSVESSRLARAHNDANILSMGARLIDPSVAHHMVDVFLETEFEGGRHIQRINDLDTPMGA